MIAIGWQNEPRIRDAIKRGAIKGAYKLNETWGKTPEARKTKARNGRIAVESGQLACISRGVPSTADGILFRSQIEAMFYCVMKALGGEPRANPPRIDLPDGRSYFPDFELGRSIFDIPANVPIELKPARNAYYQKNLPKAIEAGAFVVYWNELVEQPIGIESFKYSIVVAQGDATKDVPGVRPALHAPADDGGLRNALVED